MPPIRTHAACCVATLFVAMGAPLHAQGISPPYDPQDALVGQYIQRDSPGGGRTVVHSGRGFRFATAIAPGNVPVVPPFRNDPAVTGDPDAAFVPPMRGEVVSLSQPRVIFRDRLEPGLDGRERHGQTVAGWQA